MEYEVSHELDGKAVKAALSKGEHLNIEEVMLFATIDELIELRQAVAQALNEYLEDPYGISESRLALPSDYPTIDIQWTEEERFGTKAKKPWLAWDYDYILAKWERRLATFDGEKRERLSKVLMDEHKRRYIPDKRYGEYNRLHPYVGSVFEFKTQSGSDAFLYVVENRLKNLAAPVFMRCCTVMVLDGKGIADTKNLSAANYVAGPYIIPNEMLNERYFRSTMAEFACLFPLSEIGFHGKADDYTYAFYDLDGHKMSHLPRYQGTLFQETPATFFHSLECEIIARE